MPQPSLNQVYIDELVTGMSIAYLQDPDRPSFGRSIFPVVEVGLQTGKYQTFSKADFLRDEMTRTVPGRRPNESGFSMSTGSYSAVPWGIAHVMPDQVRASFKAKPDADFYAAKWAAQKVQLREDKLFTSAFLGTGKWGTDITGVAAGENNTTTVRQWNDAASDPIKNLVDAMRAVQKSIGRNANFIAMGPAVWDAVRIHPDIVGSLPDTSLRRATRGTFASLFDLSEDDVFVLDSVENTAAEGQTASMAHVAGKVCLVGYRSKSPALAEPSAGYTFHWDQFGAGVAAAGAPAIERFRRDEDHADVFQVHVALDMVVTASDAGYYFTSIVA